MRRFAPLLVPLIAAALPASPALAQQRPPASAAPAAPDDAARQGAQRATMVVEPVGMAMAAWDADGDGRVSHAEMTAGVERSFRAIDRSGSGHLGYLGFADWAERWLGDRNALPSPFAVDRDGDGQITLAELQAAIDAIFRRFDRDHDGFVTRAELLTIRTTPADQRGDDRRGRRGKDGAGDGAPGGRPPG